MITIKSDKEIMLMREAGRLVSQTLLLIEENIKPGVTTKELDELAYKYIIQKGSTPSFKNYQGFPASICASLNDEVVHGIPDNKKLKEGDIISIDIGVCFEGYHCDAARTFGIGAISHEAQRLIDVTEQSFYEGIKYAKHNIRLGDLSNAIQTFVESNGYSVVRKLVGHGIGANLHEDPSVPNFGEVGRGVRLVKGMAIAVEPMVNAGKFAVRTLSNDWTVVTTDGSLSAHYENTIIITDNEPEILTIT